MADRRGIGGVAGALESLLGRVAALCFRRYRETLVVVAALLGLSIWMARTLSLRADLSELLPESFQSVQALDELKERFGGVGYVAVMAKGDTPEQLEHFATDLAPKLEALDTVSYVDFKRPRDFFEDRALLYLDLPDVEAVTKRVNDRLDFEIAKRNPLYDILGEMEDQEPPSLDFSDIEKKYEGKGSGSWLGSQTKNVYYLSDAGDRIAVLAKPSRSSTDLTFSRKIVTEVKQVVGQMDLNKYGVTVEFGGNFTKKVDQQEMVTSDLGKATLMALLLIIGYLVFHFRRAAAVALVMVPLVAGLVWTYGFAAAIFGTLNIMTGFIGAILLGLGIDHGIHLLGRFASAADGDDAEAAVVDAFGHTGRAVLAAGVTTLVGFAGLGFSAFRAFREFGILAAAGVGFIVVAYVTVLPALLGVATKLGWKSRTHVGSLATAYANFMRRRAAYAGVVFLVGLVATAWFVRRATFDYNFRSLTASNLPSFRMDAEIDGVLGHSQTPVVVLASSDAEESAAADAVRERQAESGETSTIHLVAAGADLIPKQQKEKHAHILDIRSRIKKLDADGFKGKERDDFLRLQRMVSVDAFDRDSLPVSIKRRFYGKGDLRFVLVFASVDLSQGENVSRFAAELRGLKRADGEPIVVAGEPMVLADIFDLVKREAPPVLLGTLVLVFVAMWLMLGRLSMALLALLPAASSLLMTFGLMGLLGLPFNYLNIVMVPVLFGTGVDGGVHLVSRLGETSSVEEGLAETSSSITGALVTTGFGFGALMMADHLGLNSMGSLAVLGLAANVVACLLGLPPLLALMAKRRGGWGRAAEGSKA